MAKDQIEVSMRGYSKPSIICFNEDFLVIFKTIHVVLLVDYISV